MTRMRGAISMKKSKREKKGEAGRGEARGEYFLYRDAGERSDADRRGAARCAAALMPRRACQTADGRLPARPPAPRTTAPNTRTQVF